MPFGIKCMFEELSEHGNNSTDYPETARSPSLPKLAPLEKCENLLLLNAIKLPVNGYRCYKEQRNVHRDKV